jgi:MFS family permease
VTFPVAFKKQWVASAVSNIGDGMEGAAGPLLAASLTGDARLIAGVGVAQTLPWLVLSLPLGVVVDRTNRRTLMVAANWVRCALFAAIAVLTATGSISIAFLIGIIAAVGVCEVVFDMSAQAFLPAIVPAEMLEKANGRLFATEVMCNSFIGLPLGAWAFVAASGTPFAINAASFGVAAYLVGTIRVPMPTPTEETGLQAPPAGFFSQLREGLTWLMHHRLLRTMAIMLGICNMATMMGEVLLVKYASDELGVTGAGFGLLLAVMSVGSIAGGFLGDKVGARFGTAPAMLIPYATFATASLAMGLFRNIPVAVAASMATAVAGTIWNVVTVSLRQKIIPQDLFGRVNSAYRFLGTGFIAVGSLIGGFIANSHGYAAPFLVGGIIMAVTLAIGARPVATYARALTGSSSSNEY